MKIRFLIFSVFIIGRISSFSQSDLQKIQAPSSPAAAVIGIQPQEILSPKSYEALEAALFSNFMGSSGQFLIPDNIGLEFTPYWASSKRPLTIENYLFPALWECLWRNLSLSLATTKNYLLQDTLKSTAIGLGARTSLYFRDRKSYDEIMNSIKTLKDANAIKNRIAALIDIITAYPTISNTSIFLDSLISMIRKDSLIRCAFPDKSLLEDRLTEIRKYEKSLPAYNVNESRAMDKPLNDLLDSVFYVSQKLIQLEYLLNNRPGFKIDIATAFGLDFPTNSFEYSLSPLQSIWITPTYRFTGKISFLEILAVLKYTWYNPDFYKQYFPEKEALENNLDYGLSANFIFRKLSIHAEVVGRYSNEIIDKSQDASGVTTTKSKSYSDLQYLGTFSYQINKKLILSYTIGSKFKPIQASNGTLVSTFNLNFGFGGPTSSDLTK